MRFNKKAWMSGMAGAALGLLTGSAHALGPLEPFSTITYGNTNSYSLPVLAYIYDLNFGGGVGPGNPYYVASTPGSIKDLVVVYTGSGGVGVTTNTAGIEGAFPAFSGAGGNNPTIYEDFKKISTEPPPPGGPGDPSYTGTIVDPLRGVWDANVASLHGELAGGLPIFFFNNNQTKSGSTNDENLAIWAKAWLTDENGEIVGEYMYLANVDKDGNPQAYTTEGVLNGDPFAFNPGLVNPRINVDGTSDYVRSGGQVCEDFGAGVTCIDHNLGANQAAYAAVVPKLDKLLENIGYTAKTPDLTALGKYTFHLDMRIGCYTGPTAEPFAYDHDGAWTDCAGKSINNGYEQLFLGSREAPPPEYPVPEPATLILMGVALAGLSLVTRQRASRSGVVA